MDASEKGRQPATAEKKEPIGAARPSSVVIYTEDSEPRRNRNRPALLTRIMAIGSWLLVLLLIAAFLRQLHERRLAPMREELRAARELNVPAPAEPEPPPETSEPAAESSEPPPLAAPPAAPETAEAPAAARAQIAEVVLSPQRNGNFFVEGEINHHKVLFVVDTGASFVSVPDKLRWNLNLTRGRYLQSATANGVAGMYETQIDSLTIGPIRLKNIGAVLISSPMPNDVVLLGMSALSEVRLLQQDGHLVLQKEIAPDAADEGTPSPPARPAELKKSIKECMGNDKVVNERVLKCMRGEDAAEAP